MYINITIFQKQLVQNIANEFQDILKKSDFDKNAQCALHAHSFGHQNGTPNHATTLSSK